MLKYLGSIRRNLMREGSLHKYLLYAFGEILLVMIGILLALQVNNWNEKRKDAANELRALIDLKQEFSQNMAVFEDHHQFKNEIYQNWLQFVGKVANRSPQASDSPIVPRRIGVRTYNPSRSVINSVLTTGKIDKIENDSLRYFLTDWNDILLDYSEDEKRHLDFWDNQVTVVERKLFPYRFYNIESPDNKSNIFHSTEETQRMMHEAYDNLEYQNLILRNLYFIRENIRNGEVLLTTYKAINMLLDKEINAKRKTNEN